MILAVKLIFVVIMLVLLKIHLLYKFRLNKTTDFSSFSTDLTKWLWHTRSYSRGCYVAASFNHSQFSTVQNLER